MLRRFGPRGRRAHGDAEQCFDANIQSTETRCARDLVAQTNHSGQFQIQKDMDIYGFLSRLKGTDDIKGAREIRLHMMPASDRREGENKGKSFESLTTGDYSHLPDQVSRFTVVN